MQIQITENYCSWLFWIDWVNPIVIEGNGFLHYRSLKLIWLVELVKTIVGGGGGGGGVYASWLVRVC